VEKAQSSTFEEVIAARDAHQVVVGKLGDLIAAKGVTESDAIARTDVRCFPATAVAK
jgi:hypothetical protein